MRTMLVSPGFGSLWQQGIFRSSVSGKESSRGLLLWDRTRTRCQQELEMGACGRQRVSDNEEPCSMQN